MSEIKNINPANLEANPFRGLAKYPYNPDKIDALRRSIKDVGLWEGVIARKKPGGYELAFGHHRVEAARKERLDRIPVIVRDLTDRQMIEFMGRENLEDFNADFLVMLNSWEAAEEYCSKAPKSPEARGREAETGARCTRRAVSLPLMMARSPKLKRKSHEVRRGP